MGFSFNFFGKTEVRKFNYRPRFYDPDEEARKEKFGDHAAPKEYVPGEIIRGSMRDGNFKETTDVTKNQKFLGVLTMLLMFAVVVAMFKYFPYLLEAMQNENDMESPEVVLPAERPQPVQDDYEIVNLN